MNKFGGLDDEFYRKGGCHNSNYIFKSKLLARSL